MTRMSDVRKTKKGMTTKKKTEMAKVKFEIYGEEMVEKTVKLSGNSGRVYLPPDWVGSRVKVIKIYCEVRHN